MMEAGLIPHPEHIELPYRLASACREREALHGRFPDAVQVATFTVSDLAPALADRLVNLYSQLAWVGKRSDSPLVHDTGIGLAAVETSTGTTERLEDPIHREIGDLPVLDGLVSTADDELLAAYERWIHRYRELAPLVLEQWIARWARDEPLSDEDQQSGIRRDFWCVTIPLLVKPDGDQEQLLVDGRLDSGLFRRARAALMRRVLTEGQVGSESWERAQEIVEQRVWVETRNTPPARVVESFDFVVKRLSSVALAHHHQKVLADRLFADEMRRWAHESGSERLRIGISDGYRMTSVYLNERLAVEAPGFYAFRPESKRLIGKERSGPSEPALLLRRAVQERLNQAAASGGAQNRAVIRWVSLDDLPEALLNETDVDEPDELEAIVVGDWLGRYQLVGLVESPSGRPWWVSSCLDLASYGLGAPPSSVGIGDDDIPF
jgi:hypothetical protein